MCRDFDSGLQGPYHAPAMGNPLRDRRPLSDLANRSQVIDIKADIASFPRLEQIVKDDLSRLGAGKLPAGWQQAVVSGRLEFGFVDAQRQIASMSGTVWLTLDAVCQRCLRAMKLPLEVDLRLVFATAEQEMPDSGGYEVWELEETRVRPFDIVEENLVMALPLVVAHTDTAACDQDISSATADTGRTVRPFAHLKAQMGESID